MNDKPSAMSFEELVKNKVHDYIREEREESDIPDYASLVVFDLGLEKAYREGATWGYKKAKQETRDELSRAAERIFDNVIKTLYFEESNNGDIGAEEISRVRRLIETKKKEIIGGKDEST